MPARKSFVGWGAVAAFGLGLLLECQPLHCIELVAAAKGGPVVYQQSHEARSLGARRNAELRIQWKASVGDEGGRFVLYRGSSPATLQILAARVAQGRHWYEVVDPSVFPGAMLYELRFIDRQGREHVVTTETVSISIIDSQPSPLGDAASRSVATLNLFAFPVPGPGRSALAREFTTPLQQGEEPPTPPPEPRMV